MTTGLQRAAIVTGASRGIGLAIARVLASEGYALTIAARSHDDLAAAAAELGATGVQVQSVPTNVANEADIVNLVAEHARAFGRLDVLVNNAGMGIRAPLAETTATKYLDLQIAVNLRSVILAYREAELLLRQAGAEHGQALVVNVASISGKVGEADLSVYSATKHGVVGFTDAMNRELYPAGVRSCVLCPGLVDTALSDYAKPHLPSAQMVRTSDIGEAVRFLLRVSPACLIPELVFMEGAALGLVNVPGTAASAVVTSA
jgi:NAD(P)-dependent dehydrogenase (short-subunit alcohol dehydrogenase family)